VTYESSYVELERVKAAFEALPAEHGAESRAAFATVARIADATRTLPWPEFAPRALGAIRAQALTESKRDTTDGYDAAWVAHREARRRYGSFKESLTGTDFPDLLRALDETFIQLALAETGTACRTAERVIGRWAEGLATGEWKDPDNEYSTDKMDSVRWSQRMFRELVDGVTYGEEALAVIAAIERQHKLVHVVDEHRLAQVTSFQNPAIMTARAILLLLSISAEMERLGRPPVFDRSSWAESREELLRRFVEAYRFIERPVQQADGTDRPLNVSHARSLIQLRLHLALLVPGFELKSGLKPEMSFAPCLDRPQLDDTAVEELSRWLAEKVKGVRRGDANVIGSATEPSFIESVEACRRHYGATSGYRQWRARWFELDRYADETSRRDLVTRVLELPSEGAE
jgi:hypothetical protein